MQKPEASAIMTRRKAIKRSFTRPQIFGIW